MLYPIMPIYLKQIGFSIVLIGILEGVAEAIAGLSKGYFGKLSDLSGKRVPFVQFGYALSALSKLEQLIVLEKELEQEPETLYFLMNQLRKQKVRCLGFIVPWILLAHF